MAEIIIILLTIALLASGLIDDDRAFTLLAIGLTWCKLDGIRRAVLKRNGDTND